MRCLNFKLNKYHKGLFKGERVFVLFDTYMLYSFSVSKYLRGMEFPHFLIGKRGEVFMFCPTHLTCGMGSDGIYIGFENFGRLEYEDGVYYRRVDFGGNTVRFDVDGKNVVNCGDGYYDRYTGVQMEFFELLFNFLKPIRVRRLTEDSVSKAFPVHYYNELLRGSS